MWAMEEQHCAKLAYKIVESINKQENIWKSQPKNK
jgi:hypothetical protein